MENKKRWRKYINNSNFKFSAPREYRKVEQKAT